MAYALTSGVSGTATSLFCWRRHVTRDEQGRLSVYGYVVETNFRESQIWSTSESLEPCIGDGPAICRTSLTSGDTILMWTRAGTTVAVQSTATGLSCGSCGTELPPGSQFCNKCGAPVHASCDSCGVQAGDGAVRRCGAVDGHRGRARYRAVARDHDRVGGAARRRWCVATAGPWSTPATG